MAAPLETLRGLLAADVPVLLWGPPGSAKSACVIGLAEKEGAHLETLIGSTLDAADVGGMPVPFEGQVHLSAPPWARRLRAALAQGQPAWLFLDELSCSPASVQAALLRVVQERRVADMDLRGVCVVAAANPADSAADNGWLSSAMGNRFAHVQWALPSSWSTGLLTRWGQGWADGGVVAAGLVSYLQANPAALNSSPSAAGTTGYASPRSWTNAVAAVTRAGGTTAVLGRAVAAACVGPAAADEWFGWLAARDLPDPEAVLAGTCPLPVRPDQIRATLLAVVAIALADHPDKATRIAVAWRRLGDVRPDVAVQAATTLLEGAPDAALPADFDKLAAVVQAARSRAGM